MKKYFIASWTLFLTTRAISQNQLRNNRWYAHTDIPRSADIQLVFQKDSFFILSQNGKLLAEAMMFSVHSDSLYLRKLSGMTPCANQTEGLYRIEWLQNGERFQLRSLNDPCPQRVNFFTNLKLTGKSSEKDLSSDYETPEKRIYRGPEDSVAGINLYRAYELLKGRKSKTVIIAILGGGFDRSHEDLKDVLWTNEKEIPGNGIDDDKNGYVDDVWGWNFLSDKQGNTVTRLQRDVTQIYKLWKDKYENADRSKLKPEEKEEYDLYQKAKKEWEKNYQFVLAYKLVINDSAGFFNTLKDFAEHTSYDRMPKATLISYDAGGEFKKAVKKVLQAEFFGQTDSITLSNMIRNFPVRWRNLKNYMTNMIEDFDLDFEPLKIIGDDPLNVHEHDYGSPFIKKIPEITFNHDTHIAGIIGAKRNNGIGIDGIADNVKIMMIKMGAGGDERDKDIANAIRYAVDNGAKVINMSWGKKYSSHKQVVDEAIQYAEAHDVLLVHAAGNDGNDCDTVNSYYPIAKFRNGKFAENLVQVGCSGTFFDSHLPALYSNYGKNTVDLFAPGDESYGPLPNNQYGYAGGTSNAAPFVVGVAALLKSYFPELTMIQIKNIILETVYRPNIQVVRPHFVNPAFPPAQRQLLMNQGLLVAFSSLSKSGGILNAEAAVRKAIEMSKK